MQMFFFSEAKYTPVLRFLQAQYVVFSCIPALFRHLRHTPETLTTTKNKVRTCLIIFLYLFDFLLYFPCTRYTEWPFPSVFLCSGMQKAVDGPLSPTASGHPDRLYLVVFPPPGRERLPRCPAPQAFRIRTACPRPSRPGSGFRAVFSLLRRERNLI